MTTMMADQAQALRRLASETMGRPAQVVAVTSGKGGVGKSNVALNLAVRLSAMGRRVLLIDADLGTANVDVLCNLAPHWTLAHVVAGRCSLEQATIDAPGGFRLIPGASGLAQIAALSEFERARLIQQIRQLEHQFDVLLIDTGAGINPNVLSFATAADQLLVVTTPEPVAVTDAYAMIKVVQRQRPDADVSLLVNMARDTTEGKAVFDRISAVCQRFLKLTPRYAGHILLDPRVGQAVRRRHPVVLEFPTSDASVGLSQLAHRMDRHAAEPHGRNFFQRMATWLAG